MTVEFPMSCITFAEEQINKRGKLLKETPLLLLVVLHGLGCFILLTLGFFICQVSSSLPIHATAAKSKGDVNGSTWPLAWCRFGEA